MRRGVAIILKFKFIGVSIIIFVFMLADCGLADQKVIAMVDDNAITAAMLDLETSKLIPMTYFHKSVSDDRKKAATQQAFKKLLQRELIYKEVSSQGKLPDSDVIDNRFDEVRKKFSSKKEFENSVKGSGLTVSEFRKMLEKEIVEERFLKSEVEEKAVPTEDRIRDYYEKNREKFREPDKVRVLHIMIPVDPSSKMEEWDRARELAFDLIRRARSGEDFSALAYQYSKDSYRVKGGDLGFVHRGRLEREIEDAIFNLKQGEISEPVRTMYGYSVVQAGERMPETLLLFEKVREMIRQELTATRKKELLENMTAFLKNKWKVQVLAPDFSNE